MDFVNFFSSWSRTFKPTKTPHFFSFIGKDLDKEATCHRRLFPLLCVCVCVRARARSGAPRSHRGVQMAEHGSTTGRAVGTHERVSAHGCAHARAHTHLHPGWHSFFRQFCIRLLSQYSAIANCVCLLLIVCENILVEKKKKRTGFSRVLVPHGYLLSIFVITLLVRV